MDRGGIMAKKYFEEKESPVSIGELVFAIGLLFVLGVLIGEYHAYKKIKNTRPMKCDITDINSAPKELPNGQAIYDIKKLEVFSNASK